MYIMLSGRPPFGGRSNKEIIDSVLKGSYSFSNPVWNDISKEAKDLISKVARTLGGHAAHFRGGIQPPLDSAVEK